MSQREDRDERGLIWTPDDSDRLIALPGDSYAPSSFECEYDVDHDHDPDCLAYSLLREADMLGLKRPSMVQLAQRLGFNFEFDVPLGTHSFLRGSTIHITPTLDREDLQNQVGHELGHVACNEVGVPRQRQEPLAERARISLQMPEFGVCSLTRNHGFSPQMFIQFYKHVLPPTDAIRRAAYLTNTPTIMYSPVTGRTVFTETRRGKIRMPLTPKQEKEMKERVDQTGRWTIGPFGTLAFPWKLGLHKGIAITVDVQRSLAEVLYGYEWVAG